MWAVVFGILRYDTSNQIFHYARCITPKRVTTSASLLSGYIAPFEGILQRWRAVGNTVPNLAGQKFEPQASRCREERVTACPPDQ